MELEDLNTKYKSLMTRWFEIGKLLADLSDEEKKVKLEIDELREKARAEGFEYDWNDPDVLTWKKKESE